MSHLTQTDVTVGVQATQAAYTQALDAGRVDEVLATFRDDATFEIPQFEVSAQGHAALRDYYTASTAELNLRHVLANTMVSKPAADTVESSSDVLVLMNGESGWALKMVGKYRDALRLVDGEWLFERRTLSFAM